MAKKPVSASITSSRVSQPYFLHQHNGAVDRNTDDARAIRVCPIESKGCSISRHQPGLNIDGTSSEAERRDVIGGILGRHPRYRGILGWHGQDIGAGAVGCLWYPIVSTEARKHQAKAHFSLSRFGDYPISLTLTSFSSSGEFNNEFFSKLVI